MGTFSLETALYLRIISFNIRYATTKRDKGEEPWAVRCPRICNQLAFNVVGRSSFICLQEVLYSQLLDIQDHLGPNWAHIGIGRENGKTAGEFSPIFYDTNTWRCERSKTFWLSETPEKPSRGWDAVLERIVTMGSFQHKQTGARVIVMDTHFDHIGVKAREESSKLILKLAESWINEGDDDENGPRPTAFLAGDFNSTPEDKGYRTITGPESGMKDIFTLVPSQERYGNEHTYTSFGDPDKKPTRIDFLFAKDTRGVYFLTFGVLSNIFEDKVYLSDHRAIVADMYIPVSP